MQSEVITKFPKPTKLGPCGGNQKVLRLLTGGLGFLLALASLGFAQGFDASTRVVKLAALKTTKEGAGRGYWLPGVLPIYPFQMARAAISGFAEMRVVVGEDGRVQDATVMASSQKAFEEPSLQAVRSWRFAEIANPITKKRVGTTVDCRFEFSIDEDAPSEPWSAPPANRTNSR